MLPDKMTLFAAVILVSAGSLAAAQTGYDPMAPRAQPPAQPGSEPVPTNPEYENLPDTPGMEETYFQCVACHSMAIIKQQHVTDARWDYLWRWMVEEQGMFEPDEETKEVVLNYLKQHFSSER